jgi:hypothetical protein
VPNKVSDGPLVNLTQPINRVILQKLIEELQIAAVGPDRLITAIHIGAEVI